MSPVCRDETLAELKIKKRNLGENMLTRIGLIFNKFSIKNNIIHRQPNNRCRKKYNIILYQGAYKISYKRPDYTNVDMIT